MVDPAQPVCSFCGTVNDTDAIFCGRCGKELQNASISATEKEQVRAALGALPVIGREEDDSQTNPGFSDPSLEFVSKSFAEAKAHEAAQQKPILPESSERDEPQVSETPNSKQEVPSHSSTNPGMPPVRSASPTTNEPPSSVVSQSAFTQPSAPSSASSPTLMSETPFRSSFLTPSEQPDESPQQPAPEANDSPVIESPSPEDQQLESSPVDDPIQPASPYFAQQQEEATQLPPLSKEASALLDRFASLDSSSVLEHQQALGNEEGSKSTLKEFPPGSGTSGKSSSVPPQASSPRSDVGGRTMLGMPVPSKIRTGSESEEGSRSASPKKIDSSTSPSPVVPPRRAEGGMTMLGMPQVLPAHSQSSKPAASRIADEGGMTMLGLPTPAKKSSEPAPVTEAQDFSETDFSEDFGRLTDDPTRRARRWIALAIILAALFIGAAGAAAMAFFLSHDRYSMTTEVTVEGERSLVTIALRPVPESGSVRFGGQEQPLVGGRATFEIPSANLRVGVNELPVEVVDSEGNSSSSTVSFDLSYRAIADLSGLRKNPAHYTVRFEVIKGAALKVAGHPVELDEKGVYLHLVPLSEALAGAVAAGDSVVHRVPFSVQIGEEAERSESVDTAIPRTPLRIQAPTEGSVFESKTIRCLGVTHETASVTINGTKVTTTAGRFEHEISLPTVGEHDVEVVAVAPGRVPHTVRFKVRRVENLAPLIRAFARTVDPNLTYKRVSEDPESVRGRAVRFHGKVVALESLPTGIFLQLLVDEGCSEGQQCSIHVTYHGMTKVQRYSDVTVFGVMNGRWEGRTQSGSPLVLPKVQAQFIVPDRGTR